jgi:hypothetical protein
LSNGNKTLTVPLASVTGTLTLNTWGGNDTLTVDYSGGDLGRPIAYNGGNPASGPGDKLVIQKGSSSGLFNMITHSFASASDGSIALDPDGPGGAAPSTIQYTGLEPVADNMDAANRVFSFTGGVETINLTDTGGADGLTTIDSTLSESVPFANPTVSLTIEVNGGDTVNLNSLDAAFAAAVTLNGTGAANDFRLTAAEVLPNATDLTVTGSAVFNLNGFAETIDALEGNGTIDNTAAGASSLTVGSNGGSGAFSGPIQCRCARAGRRRDHQHLGIEQWRYAARHRLSRLYPQRQPGHRQRGDGQFCHECRRRHSGDRQRLYERSRLDCHTDDQHHRPRAGAPQFQQQRVPRTLERTKRHAPLGRQHRRLRQSDRQRPPCGKLAHPIRRQPARSRRR